MKVPNKMLPPGAALLTMLSAVLLLGCGGGGSQPYPVRQFGVTEAQLMDLANNPNGIVVGRGSGMVVLQMEPAGGQPAPVVGDTASRGVDELWFDVDYPGTVSVDLTGDSLSVASQVAVLDAKGKPLLTADAVAPKASVLLAAGRYLLRFTAAAGATETVLGMVWFGGEPKLGPVNLRGTNLTESDLSHALLLRVTGGLTLSDTEVMSILLGSSKVRGADLSGANLAGARLDGALLTGSGRSAANLGGTNLTSASATDLYLARANLSGATLTNADLSRSVLTGANLRGAELSNAQLVDVDLSGADLTGANATAVNLTRANLSGANWVDGRTCASGSVGECR